MQKHNQYNINFDGYRFYPNVLLISSAVAGPVFYEEKLGYMFREINICSACKTNTKHIGKPIQHVFTELGTVHRKWRYLSNDTTDARTLAHELQARSVRPDFQKYRMLNRDELKTDGRTNPDERSGIGRRLTLRHTFSSELCGGQPGHTANHNLMDYGFGTGLNRFQWEAIHNPALIGKVFQDDEDGGAFNQPGTDMQVICDPILLDKINENKIFYTPDQQLIDLSKIENAVANKFYTLQDVTPEARGALNGFIKDGKQYVLSYGVNSLEVKRFYTVGDEMPIENILYTGTDTPKKINIDCENKSLWIGNSTEEYGFECNDCESPDVSCAELLVKYKDSPVMQSRVLRTAILEDPCILERGGLTIHFPDYIEYEESELSKIAAVAMGVPLVVVGGGIIGLPELIKSGITGITIIATSSTTALVITKVTDEVQLLLEFIGTSYKLFLAGVAISEGTQFFGNYAFYGNYEDAWDNMDHIDAIADGALFAITMNAGNAANMLQNGRRFMIFKPTEQMAQVFTIEFVKSTYDFTLESSELKSVFNGKKESYEVFCDFLFSIIGSKVAGGIQGRLISWSNADITNADVYKLFTPERKALADQIDAIVKSDGFNKAINVPTSALNKFINDFAKKNFRYTFRKIGKEETSFTLEDYIKEQCIEPIDNTKINSLIVKPIDNTPIRTIITSQ